jgi:deoxycytidylate deaminase
MRESYTEMSFQEMCAPPKNRLFKGNANRLGTFELPHTPLSRSQRSFLDLATKVAETSDVNRQHGAVVVRGGRVLSVGINRYRSRHTTVSESTEYDPNISTHAEADALSRVPDPRGATIYVARVDKQGRPRFSRPCENCTNLLEEAGVKRVIYTTDQHKVINEATPKR